MSALAKYLGRGPVQTPSKIIGIQFSILSPNEILEGSVAEITTHETYIGNKPQMNGVFDSRMGVLEHGYLCPTDGLDYMHTPGYFGHIKLATPVFYMQYMLTIIKVIRCVCPKCSKLVINKEVHLGALNMSPEERLKFVYSKAAKIRRCGTETNDGCGHLLPDKVQQSEPFKLVARWKQKEGDVDITSILTASKVKRIFCRISDEDVIFLGLSPLWSRPEWMICEVMAVPPPAVRPSVKQNSQQRSEDDLTYALINIIKTNNLLKDKIAAWDLQGTGGPWQANAGMDNYAKLLQYYVATLVDNKIQNVPQLAQRSNRPLKTIKERINGKAGRVRGNLMGKRVNFSARTVITPDPNISIGELGIPLKIAQNLTKPVVVNARNLAFLRTLVINGADKHPGAKRVDGKPPGRSISLTMMDEAGRQKKAAELQFGDVVHRHLMNGDPVLFNRQPTLHRMSMMCHKAKIMPVGETFRMNVGDTKPYNADFDGDEMNLHMPQDVESDAELLLLAAVPWQIINPGNNGPIIGIFQDSLLGAFLFSNNVNVFTPQQAMNLLMACTKVDVTTLQTDQVSSFQVLSQIMPPLTLQVKPKDPNDQVEKLDPNKLLLIGNGRYVQGQLSDAHLSKGPNNLIQRVCNDFGNAAAVDFIDDLQNVVTEYMKTRAFSVGISDLYISAKTDEEVAAIIAAQVELVALELQAVHQNKFVNTTGLSNQTCFENKVTNLLAKATKDATSTAKKALKPDNRFITMAQAGSKGGDVNIAQMVACLGAQMVENKRVPYGFEHRTLPHFPKYDDSPTARGYVKNSFIGGLTPEELFFHAMGGRIGIIDTAVKTSETGYIQRRLVKGMEDLKVAYDMTVRNSSDRIVQFTYGGDGFDPVKVELQTLPIAEKSYEQLYQHYTLLNETQLDYYTTPELFARANRPPDVAKVNKRTQDDIDFVLRLRDQIVNNVFNGKSNNAVNLPVAFEALIFNMQGQFRLFPNSRVDLTPLDAYALMDDGFRRLEALTFVKPTDLFKVLYYYYLNPANLLPVKRFTKAALTMLLELVILMYKKAIIAPGELVGIIAAQSIGEPTTQMTLNTFHFAGVASKSNVTRGIPRLTEILNLSANPKKPACTIYLHPAEEVSVAAANRIKQQIEFTPFRAIVDTTQLSYEPAAVSTDASPLYKRFNDFEERYKGSTNDKSEPSSNWVISFELNKVEMLQHNLTMADVHFAISAAYMDDIDNMVYSDDNEAGNLVFRLKLNRLQAGGKSTGQKSLDESDHVRVLTDFQTKMLDNLVLRGVPGISQVTTREILDDVFLENDVYKTKKIHVLDTAGSNLLELLGLDDIDVTRTYSNDICEVHSVLGVEAARHIILQELVEVMSFDGKYINYHHFNLLCDRMTCRDEMVAFVRHGINSDDIGPIAKASFEETPKIFLKAAEHGELDTMRGVSANVMCGQEGFFGTAAFHVLLDMSALPEPTKQTQADDWRTPDRGADRGPERGRAPQNDGPCAHIAIASSAAAVFKETVVPRVSAYELDLF